MAVILTIDLGTSTTKAALWDEGGLVAVGRSPVATTHPAPGRAEQDAGSWWPSVTAACAEVRGPAGRRYADAAVVGFATARQTLVPVSAEGEPLAPALVWSDRRAAAEAAALAGRCGGRDAVWGRTGMVLDGAAVAAKVAWLLAHAGPQLEQCRWLLGPRDTVLWRMSGRVATDTTVASASGLYGRDGCLVAELAGPAAGLLPEPVEPPTVVGALRADAAEVLGLRAGIPLVPGAGDRACEALGAGAGPDCASVSWGTTANVSLPVATWPEPMPAGLQVTRAARDGWLIEGGVSAAGALLTWLGGLTGSDPATLLRLAGQSPPGARGVLALPWLGGARAPWWRDAGAGFVGLSPAAGPGDLARALIEAVAFEVARCIDRLPARPSSLSLAGAAPALWHDIITAVTALPGRRGATGEAASAGAAMLSARAVGMDLDAAVLNPAVGEVVPDPALQERYARLRPDADRIAESVMGAAMAEVDSPE